MKSKIEVFRLVNDERIRQDKKWGFPQDNTPFEWVSILVEEVGEFAQAMNNALLGGVQNVNFTKALQESVQVAAVAISIVEHLAVGNQEKLYRSSIKTEPQLFQHCRFAGMEWVITYIDAGHVDLTCRDGRQKKSHIAISEIELVEYVEGC